MKNTYSNPRTFAEFTDWPYGRRLKTVCTFTVETLNAGSSQHRERISKVTINPTTGRENKAKKTTFAPAVRIVDGSDGKTYLLQRSSYGETIYIKKSDFFDFESVTKEEFPKEYAALNILFLDHTDNFYLQGKAADEEQARREMYFEIDHNQNQE